MAALFLFGALVFSAALLLASGAYLAWRGMRNRAPGRVAQRVRNASRGSADSHPALSISKQRLLARHPLLQRALQALPPAAVLDRLLLQAGRQQTVAQLLGWSLAALLGGLRCWGCPCPCWRAWGRWAPRCPCCTCAARSSNGLSASNSNCPMRWT